MNKAELAAYLVSLHSLMEAQEATARVKSHWLVNEYMKTWQEFQDAVTNERKDEE